jgi:hypothetical protein
MLVNLYLQQWHRSEIAVWLAAITSLIIGVSLAGPIVQSVESPAWAVLLLAVPGGLVVGGLGWWYQQSKNRLDKVFFVPHDMGVRIIGNVLRQKGLPFQRVGPTNNYAAGRVVFVLEKDILVIHVSPYLHRGISGTAVSLGPITKGNRPLVQSLQGKIDNAFAPRGLA